MRPTRSKLFAMLALAGLASFATPALAGPGHGPGARLEKHLKTLGLDPTQQQKVQAILDAAKPQREQIRRSALGVQDMHNCSTRTPDQAAVLSRRRRRPAQTEMLRGSGPAGGARRADPDQRAMLKAEMMKNGYGRWRHHRGGEQGAGAPPEPPPED
jgi:hypothetical protein